VALIFVVAAVLILAGCEKHGDQAALLAPERPPAPVVAVPAVAQDVPLYIDEIGRTAARESVTVQPQLTGKVVEIHFTDGQNVKKGELLFRIDPRPFQATLAQAEASLAQARADLEWSQSEFKRFSEVQASGAVSKTDIEQKRNAVNVAEAKVKAAEASVERARLDLEYCTITSPIDGRAGQHLVDV
jgi:RND family efflux transporter MFP subunit